MGNIYKTALDKLIALYRGYSNEYRYTTQPYHLEKAESLIQDFNYNPSDKLIREPLIEHVGSLPIVATTLYPYIKNPKVNLGKALIMLAIHDIGELIVHDEITFTKNAGNPDEEEKQALKILPDLYHGLYLEMENRTSDTARFAKAVDKITPDIIDLMTPAEITIIRYEKFIRKKPREIVPTIKEFKHPYMLWNEFMTNLHLELLDRLENKLKKYTNTIA